MPLPNVGRRLAPFAGVLMAFLISSPALGATTFGGGTHRVGTDIPAGTYRTRLPAADCYWERLRGFSGDFDDIIANDFSSGYHVVTIKSTDKGFSSSRCGRWSSNLARVTSSMTSFGQGDFIVGVDMRPGTYRSSKGGSCYWERLSNFTGNFSAIIANHYGSRGLVTIRSTDRGFSSSNCGSWTRI